MDQRVQAVQPVTTGGRYVVPDHREMPLQQAAFSPVEAGKLLGLPAYTVRRLIQSGKLRARSTGGRYIIAGSALADFLAGSDEPMRHPGTGSAA